MALMSDEHSSEDLKTKIISLCRQDVKWQTIRPQGLLLPFDFGNPQEILDLPVHADDTWIISFPKSGTTWTQEMVWLLQNKCDFHKAKSIPLTERCSFLELPDGKKRSGYSVADFMSKQKSPRFIKSHLHKELLPLQLWDKKPKVVYVFRDPKDVAISLYHHYRLFYRYTGSLDLFLSAFLEEKVILSPYWKHILDFWTIRHEEDNLLFLTYAEMKKDLKKAVRKTADFLKVEYNKSQEDELLEHLSFKNMKNNPSVNYQAVLKKINVSGGEFLRKGDVGGWKREMSDEMVKRFEKWTEFHLRGSDFPREDLK